jgi:hypothetical protein
MTFSSFNLYKTKDILLEDVKTTDGRLFYRFSDNGLYTRQTKVLRLGKYVPEYYWHLNDKETYRSGYRGYMNSRYIRFADNIEMQMFKSLPSILEYRTSNIISFLNIWVTEASVLLRILNSFKLNDILNVFTSKRTGFNLMLNTLIDKAIIGEAVDLKNLNIFKGNSNNWDRSVFAETVTENEEELNAVFNDIVEKTVKDKDESVIAHPVSLVSEIKIVHPERKYSFCLKFGDNILHTSLCRFDTEDEVYKHIEEFLSKLSVKIIEHA